MINTEKVKIEVWVGDLYEYTSGLLTGEWVTLPMDLEDIASMVLTHSDHELFVADYNSDIKGLDNLSLQQINEVAEMLEGLEPYQHEEFMMVLNASDSIEEGLEIFENESYRVFHECENMKDVAMQWYEETGLLHQMNEAFEEYVQRQYDLPNIAKEFLKEELTDITRFYLDYEAIGLDMEINRHFHKANRETYIELFR